jgi:hypothetical protein
MKPLVLIPNVLLLAMLFALGSCSVQEEKPEKPAAAVPTAPAPAAKAETKAPAEKAPEKAKAEKTKGDIGLVDPEKNYMILVTKEGKLVTLDFDQKTKVSEVTPTPAKVADVGLGSSATVTYTEEKGKNIATAIEFKPAKGGD